MPAHVAAMCRRPTGACMTLRFRRDRAPGCCSYRPAMRSCIGRRRARRCSSKAPLHRYGCRGGCDACGLHRQAASGWHSAKTMSLSRRHDRHQCWDQPRRQGGGVQRPWAATWAPRPLHQIFMRLGLSLAAEMRLAKRRGAKGTRSGERWGRAGKR